MASCRSLRQQWHFAVEDRRLLKSLWDGKGCGARRLCKILSDKRWKVNGLKTLNKENW